MSETDVQKRVVDRLVKKGFEVNGTISGNEPGTIAVMLRNKPNRHTTILAEVEADGTVNGEAIDEFLRRL